jgi:hypothetical protein
MPGVPYVSPSYQWQLVEREQLHKLQQEQLAQAQFYLQKAICCFNKLSQQDLKPNKIASDCDPPKKQRDEKPEVKTLPEFSKVYHFMGSLFDPNSSGHLAKLDSMSDVDREIIQVFLLNLAKSLANHAQSLKISAPPQTMPTSPSLIPSLSIPTSFRPPNPSPDKSPMLSRGPLQPTPNPNSVHQIRDVLIELMSNGNNSKKPFSSLSPSLSLLCSPLQSQSVPINNPSSPSSGIQRPTATHYPTSFYPNVSKDQQTYNQMLAEMSQPGNPLFTPGMHIRR